METEWARSYERSRLRSWARFPRNDDIYEAIDDTSVQFLTHWRAALSDGRTGTLPRGTRIRVEVFDLDLEPISVFAAPLNPDVIEPLLVAESERTAPKYDGFILSIQTADLNRMFRLVSLTA